MRIVLNSLFAFVLLSVSVLALLLTALWPRYRYHCAVPPPFVARRFEGNPIIFAGLDASLAAADSAGGYVNIAGPSVIRVPDWVDNLLGLYYLYFAHHKGSYIRMAYADSPTGPWLLHQPGALSLVESDWNAWVASEGVALMRPELPWEGSELPVMSSLRGELNLAGNELRNPFIFVDGDGRRYLYSVGAGEQAIGVTQLQDK